MTRQEKEYEVFLIKVDAKRCNGCGQCIECCPVDVFEARDGKPIPVSPQNCLGCDTCRAICEKEAIIITEI
ncbi:MAG: 4Fe-4S dicluster domain-containing protein [Deltaproteobacteria bacterium]|nr:4Fe-4S dicluster domain-containing protein [Deltaproteobacteria bacterium]